MKLSKRTVEILKNYSSINQSILFKPGNVISTVSPLNSIFAKAIVEENFPIEFAIFNLHQLLSVLSLLGENEITFEETNLVIKNENQSVKYVYADPSMIEIPDINNIPLKDELISFSLPADTLIQLNKVRMALELNGVAIVGDNGKYSIQGLDSQDVKKNVFSVDISPTSGDLVQPDKIFKIIFNQENFKLMPDNYQVEVRSMKKGYAGKFKSENGPEYIIAVARESRL